jgi:hypothetical protein
MSIYNFQSGDYVIRVEPAKVYIKVEDEFGNERRLFNGLRDDLRGFPVEFVGVANNLIYLKRIQVVKGRSKPEPPFLYTLFLEHFEEGWQYFQIPPGLAIEESLPY